MTTKQETTFPFNTSITGNDALFNDYSLMTHPLLPTTTSTPQDLSHLLQLDSNQPFVIDDWLATELHQSGLLPPTSSGSSTSSGVSSPELPNSPPLTASPPSKESTSPSSVYQLQQQQQQPCVPLFPEIAPKQQQQQQQQRRLVPIMPKTEMIAAAAAAMSTGHDSLGATTPVLSVSSHGNNKRKASCDKEREDIVLKRQRNTDAARRSRLKKLLKMEALEKRVNELEGENTRLTTRVAVLESEKSGLENKDKDLQERIRVLEEQLAEAHKALTSKCSH
ncbi:hypothetical protein LRAMOSA07582 [Lichtheimia ramosa]|uniref:BZIP domain-containing protein n=1 Tax=Lichtheimia ramosa TaxID=688394 RepID=A0A077WDB3_9FUNG|nr:hypothetical protein LRAMOSA07582 [Lichtheimia ramosa]